MEWTQTKINEVYIKTVNLAMTDKEFRKKLLENPNAAIERITGETLPENYAVKVIENDPAYLATFTLPPLISNEMSDDDLDFVAGGQVQPFGDCGTKFGK